MHEIYTERSELESGRDTPSAIIIGEVHICSLDFETFRFPRQVPETVSVCTGSSGHSIDEDLGPGLFVPYVDSRVSDVSASALGFWCTRGPPLVGLKYDIPEPLSFTQGTAHDGTSRSFWVRGVFLSVRLRYRHASTLVLRKSLRRIIEAARRGW